MGAQTGTTTLPSAPEASVQRFEVGLQYAFLGKGTCFKINCDVPPEVGLSAAFTWNATPHLAVDTAVNMLLATERTPQLFRDTSFAGGRGTSVAAGPRLEVRREHYGLFIYGQLGAELWTRAPDEYIYNSDHQLLTLSPPDSLRAAISVAAGYGAEYSPSPRLHFRVATGERVVDYGRRYGGTPCSMCEQAATAWDAGDDLTAGVYMGVGPSPRNEDPTMTRFPRIASSTGGTIFRLRALPSRPSAMA